MNRSWLFVLLALALSPSPGFGQDLGDLGGSLDVSHVDAKIDEIPQESWRQLYTLDYTKRLTDYIGIRAGFRYYKFDLDAASLFGSFQEEIQPSGELRWAHPWFRFTGNAVRRISRSPAISGDLLTDTILLNWESRWVETPVFGIRYERQDTKETGADATRGVEDERLTGSIDYTRPQETFSYRLTRQWATNVIRGLDSTEYRQRLSYVGGYRFGRTPNISWTPSIATRDRIESPRS